MLFTFALGTAAGDLISEKFALGYFVATLLFASLIAAIALAHWKLGLNSVFAFWSAYILTRPLGASVGDLMGQHHGDGGLGFGKLTRSRIDVTHNDAVQGIVARGAHPDRVDNERDDDPDEDLVLAGQHSS